MSLIFSTKTKLTIPSNLNWLLHTSSCHFKNTWKFDFDVKVRRNLALTKKYPNMTTQYLDKTNYLLSTKTILDGSRKTCKWHYTRNRKQLCFSALKVCLKFWKHCVGWNFWHVVNCHGNQLKMPIFKKDRILNLKY